MESETHGDTALGTTRLVSGWTVRDLPSGESVASVEVDYIENTDFTWTSEMTTNLQETLPAVFSSVSDCSCKVTDISVGRTYLNAIMVAVKELFSTTVTDKITVVPMETNQGISVYTTPTKLHALWTVRGIRS